MLGINPVTIAISAAGAILIGCCFYFDKKRRADPNYKKKVLERRCLQVLAKVEQPIRNYQDVFFRYNIALGQTLLRRGELNEGLKLIAIAVISSNKLNEVLMQLRSVMNPMVFQLLQIKVRAYMTQLEEDGDNDTNQTNE